MSRAYLIITTHGLTDKALGDKVGYFPNILYHDYAQITSTFF